MSDKYDNTGGLWKNDVTGKATDKRPHFGGSITIQNSKIPIVAWFEENPNGGRPNISIRVEKGFQFSEQKEMTIEDAAEVVAAGGVS